MKDTAVRQVADAFRFFVFGLLFISAMASCAYMVGMAMEREELAEGNAIEGGYEIRRDLCNEAIEMTFDVETGPGRKWVRHNIGDKEGEIIGQVITIYKKFPEPKVKRHNDVLTEEVWTDE